ncbi:hypothetical protein [Brevibacterium sp. FME17]|uniref:hypothetical protein n=1 Tax=Brevibacterium sp. FME17 TaxID=2742606 RepID=UPI001D012B00|nr:hypothetical protein [Brevibacterium sp. FME17]
MTKETITAGPALSLASRPVSVKMPALPRLVVLVDDVIPAQHSHELRQTTTAGATEVQKRR